MKELKWKWFIMLFVFLLSFTVTTIAQQVVHGCVPSSIKNLGLLPLARVDGAQKLTLGIGLSLRNRDALMNLIQELYDPTSSKFHQWLTPEQFTERFGPSQADYQVVINYAKANGFNIIKMYSDRKMIKVSGSVRDIEKAFHLKMMIYNNSSKEGTFYAPDTEPTLDLSVPISNISGLQNSAVLVSYHNRSSGNSIYSGSKNGMYISQDFRAAYLPGDTLAGWGQTIGLVAASAFNPTDITTYENNTGLPHHTIETVLLDGASGSYRGHQFEVCLDIEMAIAMAPRLSKVVIYVIPDDTGSILETRFENMLYRMAQDTYIKQFSCSYGLYYPSEYLNPTADMYFLQMISQGQSFFQASGDYDAVTNTTYQFTFNNQPRSFSSYFHWPCSNPYVTLVGGTNLTTSGAGGYYISESVWNTKYRGFATWETIGSTGGASSLHSIPQWQIGANPSNNQVSTSKRNSPDVTMVASNIYEYVAGREHNVSGTSASAPLWAGFTALANQYASIKGRSSIGFINPTIYAIGKGLYYGSAFHDITAGDNIWDLKDVIPATSSNPYFSATTSYDLCAGWGSPRGPLINLLSAIVWSGTKTLSSSFTVPSGQTLIILSGSTIKFAGTASLVVYGKMNITGVTFTRSGSSGNWGSIQFNGSGASNSSLDYCNIQYGTQIDVINGANNISIRHCTIQDNSGHGINVSSSSNFLAGYNIIRNGNVNHGIAISGGTNNRCSGNTIYKYVGSSGYQRGSGIQYSSSSGVINGNDIEYYSWGIGAIYGSSINSGWSYGSDHNNRMTNCLCGIRVYQNSWCDLGKVVGGMDDGNGNNTIKYTLPGNYSLVEVGNQINDPNTLYACDNWWGTDPPQQSKFVVWPYSSTFTYTPWLHNDPWGQYPLPLISGQSASNIEVNRNLSLQRAVISSVQIQDEAFAGDNQALLLIDSKFKGKKKEAVEYLKSYIKDHPDDYAGYVIMYSLADSTAISDIINLFKSASTKAPKMHKLLLGNLYQMEGKPMLAKNVYNEIISENPNASIAVMASVNNMLIELYNNNNVQAAKIILDQIRNQKNLISPGELADAEVTFATYLNPETGTMPNINLLQNTGETPTEASASTQKGLMENYPNPFNPSTSIGYQLSDPGNVTLKIYDILGKEVATLVNENQEIGIHFATFDGSRCASGVYFYRLMAPGINQVKKMLLTK